MFYDEIHELLKQSKSRPNMGLKPLYGFIGSNVISDPFYQVMYSHSPPRTYDESMDVTTCFGRKCILYAPMNQESLELSRFVHETNKTNKENGTGVFRYFYNPNEEMKFSCGVHKKHAGVIEHPDFIYKGSVDGVVLFDDLDTYINMTFYGVTFDRLCINVKSIEEIMNWESVKNIPIHEIDYDGED